MAPPLNRRGGWEGLKGGLGGVNLKHPIFAGNKIYHRYKSHRYHPDRVVWEVIQVGEHKNCGGTKQQTGHIYHNKPARLPVGLRYRFECPELVPEEAVGHAGGEADYVGRCGVNGGDSKPLKGGAHICGRATRE